MNKIKAGFIATILSVPMISGCIRAPLHQVKSKSNEMVALVDSFTKSNQIDTTGLVCFRTDTLKVNMKKLKNPKFTEELNWRARFFTPQKTIESHFEYGPTIGPHYHISSGEIRIAPGFGIHHEATTEPLYLLESARGVVQNKVYANPKGNKYYVPVSYYGEPNPLFAVPKDSVQ